MKIRQLSLFLENKPGRLQEAFEAIGQSGVNVESTTLVEAGDFGILRALVKDVDKAYDALRARFTVKKSDVLAIQADDAPGALAKILAIFAKDGLINVEYLYGFTSKKGVAAIIMSVNDSSKAVELLAQGNVKLLSSDELFS